MAQTNLSAGSYALEAGGIVSQKNVGRQLGQTGMQGGQVFAPDAQRRVEIDTSTSDLLMQLGSKILEPQIKKVQTENFLKGAQRVAQGEALKDIVDEQPWFTQIFGPSSSVQGARTVAQMKGVDDYVTSVANDMPQLQKLSPQEFGARITEKMGDFLTGDSVADAAIQLKMVESTGSLFKAHTKANYKYTQDTMQANTVGYMRSGGEKLKALSTQLLNGTMTQTDYDAAKADFVNNLMPIEGQSAESYWGGVEAATIDALANGNHHAANSIFDSGIFNSAPTEMRKKMIDARFTYEAKTQETAGFNDYGPRIGVLKGMAAAGQLTVAQIGEEADKINKDYALKYGINRPLFKRKEFEALVSGNVSAIYNRAEQDRRDLIKENRQDQREAAKEQAKAETELRKGQQLVSMIQMGAGNNAKMAGYSDDEVNNAVYVGAQTIAAKGGNVGEYLVLQYNQGAKHINPLYQNQMQAGMRAAVMEGHSGKAFDTSYGLFKQISSTPGGQGAAVAYLGDDGIKMMKYDALIQSPTMTKELAYTLSFATPLDTSRKSTDKDIAPKLEKFINSKDPGIIDRSLFSDIPLTEQSKRVLLGAVGANYDKLVGIGMSDDAALPVAYSAVKAEYDVAGPYVIHKGPNKQPLYQLIGSDEEAAGKVFSSLIAQRARENGVTVELPGSPAPAAALQGTADFVTMGTVPALKRWKDRAWGEAPDVMVQRLPDQDGQAMFGVTITDQTGHMTHFPVTSKEVRAVYEKSPDFK